MLVRLQPKPGVKLTGLPILHERELPHGDLQSAVCSFTRFIAVFQSAPQNIYISSLCPFEFDLRIVEPRSRSTTPNLTDTSPPGDSESSTCTVKRWWICGLLGAAFSSS